jgi:chromosome segregation ATPase
MAKEGGAEGDIRWETYPAGARLLGMKVESFRRLAIRKGWRRTPGNDGLARVAIPVAEIGWREGRRYHDEAGSRGDARDGAALSDAGGATAAEPQALAALVDALRREREGREAAEAAARQATEAVARTAGEVNGLMEAIRLAEENARRADETRRDADTRTSVLLAERDAAQQRADKARRDADAQVAVLRAERDAAQQRAVEAVTVMGQLARRLEDYQRQVTEAARQATEAEQRATALDAARQEAQNRLAQFEEEAKSASMQGIDLAELETAQARATEAEQRAIEAKRLADEADRRATTATERLERFQRERIAQAQAAAENTRAFSQEVVPLWRRVFGRRRRP